MGIFRFAFFVFLVALMISLATSLFGGAAAAGAAIGGAMLFLPILFFKVVLFVMLFGFFGRMATGSSRHRGWGWPHGWSQTPASASSQSDEDRFDEWHRMAHARDEVDSWTPEV